MAYQALINKGLRLTFKMMKDLVTEVVLTKSEVSDFDFSDGETTEVSSSLITEGIVLETKKTSDKSNTIKSSVLLKTEDIGDLNLFDTLILNGVAWRVGTPISNNGFATVVEIYREV